MVLHIITVVVLILTCLFLMANLLVLTALGKMFQSIKPITDIMRTPKGDSLHDVLDIFAN